MAEYARNGFTGGLNWYRNLDRNWALTAAWHGAPITPPALFLAGEQDMVVAGIGADALAATLRRTCTDLRGARLLPGCGHWTQQERPAEVSAALIAFATDPDRLSPTREGAAHRQAPVGGRPSLDGDR